MPIPLAQVDGMPVTSPYFPRPPARYRGMRAQTVLFRADPNRVADLLPECLAPADDGACAAIGVDAPWSSHYGAFQAIVIAAGCRFEGHPGSYVVVQYVNSRGSIPAGREIWGTPKVWADMRVEQAERVMATTAAVGGADIAAVRSTAHRPCDPADLPALAPMWRLKVIPRAGRQRAGRAAAGVRRPHGYRHGGPREPRRRWGRRVPPVAGVRRDSACPSRVFGGVLRGVGLHRGLWRDRPGLLERALAGLVGGVQTSHALFPRADAVISRRERRISDIRPRPRGRTSDSRFRGNDGGRGDGGRVRGWRRRAGMAGQIILDHKGSLTTEHSPAAGPRLSQHYPHFRLCVARMFGVCMVS